MILCAYLLFESQTQCSSPNPKCLVFRQLIISYNLRGRWDEVTFKDNYPKWKAGWRIGPVPLTTRIPSLIKLDTIPTSNVLAAAMAPGECFRSPIGFSIRFLESKTMETVASSKTISFFLVDDTSQDQQMIRYPEFDLGGLKNMNVLTTSEVSPQMRTCNEPTMFALISAVSARLTGGRAVPPEFLDTM
ncbi:hypothetical protein BDP27DRAFT_1548070 [Rhodocollybia butyracea]|uniref:Uncharacterized protein n=1 Tax=Rhodocollybia butyracea TaxID=206335 RepID=A0A9P5PQ31_9AGAR|nr:hypothetical protein BDP27DRAFT_1548070 [Rhodocollybia butyracea]